MTLVWSNRNDIADGVNEECSKSAPDITDINVVKWSDKRLICKTSDPIPARMNIRGMFEVEFIRNDKG